MPTSFLPMTTAHFLLAQSRDSAAFQAGFIIGVLIGIVLLVGLLAFTAWAIYKACTRRTTGWIVAACIAGVCLSIPLTAFCVGIVRGITKARQRQIEQRADGTVATPAGGVTEALHGRNLPYTLTVPPGWAVKPPVGNFDLLAASKDVYVGVVAEEGSLGTPEAVAVFAQENLRKVSTNLQFGATTLARIDGRDWRQYTAKCELNKVPLAYHCYVYAGPEGSYQIIGWTLQNLFDRRDAALRSAAESFRFPPSGTQPATTSVIRAPPKLVGGNSLHYWLSVPSDWEVQADSKVFDLRVSHGSLYLGVTAEEGSLGHPETVLKIVQANLRKIDKDVQFSEALPVKIDGRDWLQFTAKCTLQNLPFMYQQYVYAGPEGTYRLVGWTMQNLYERDADKLRDVAMSFHFPHGSAPSPTPTPEPAPTVGTQASSSPTEPTPTPTPVKRKQR